MGSGGAEDQGEDMSGVSGGGIGSGAGIGSGTSPSHQRPTFLFTGP